MFRLKSLVEVKSLRFRNSGVIKAGTMLKVKSRTGESVQQMMRRFKKLCEKEGLIRDMKRMSYYEKPSEKERRRIRKAQRTASFLT